MRSKCCADELISKGKCVVEDCSMGPPERLPVDDKLYDELWQLCAGRQFYMPKTGERVFYFPQGHIEQVQAYTNQGGKMEMPIYDVPWKILCEVINVDLKIEPETDEVFAQITLIPAKQQELIWYDRNEKPAHRRLRGTFFSKTLTPSDTSTHGGFSIPKRHADECFPPLDMSMNNPAQALVMKDLQGKEWHFRQIYRGQPRRHLITTGWSAFVSAKKLVPGDTCIFIRGETGEIRIGTRRSVKSQRSTLTSVISGYTMHHGILSSAFHAISTGTMFSVYCRPWTSSAPFVISVSQYMKSMEDPIGIDTNFRMMFESEECVEQSFGGSVVNIEEVDPMRWPDSKWRCLKVRWDSLVEIHKRPERVSPWSIEVSGPVKRKQDVATCPEKRARPPDPTLPGTSNSVKGLWGPLSGRQPRGQLGVFQGQEGKGKGKEKATSDPTLQNKSILESGQQMIVAIHKMFRDFKPFQVNDGEDGTAEKPSSYNVSTVGLFQVNDAKDGTTEKPSSSNVNTVRLFGVNIVAPDPSELPSHANFGGSQSPESSLIQSMSQCSVSSNIGQSKRGSPSGNPFASKSCIKVFKHGVSPGRSINLNRLDGYDELVRELDGQFGFNGSLVDGTSGWQVTYTDNDGDLMLLGDYPWQEFVKVAQRMLIRPKGDSKSASGGLPRSMSF